jgi:hypothetical protein
VATEPSEPEPATPRRSLPWILFAISTAVAVLAATGLVFFIGQRTTGPAEVLRDFHAAAHDGDCGATLDLMTEELRAALEDNWCRLIEGGFPSDFTVDEISLVEDVAIVAVVESGSECQLQWKLTRSGKSWLVSSVPQERLGGRMPTRCIPPGSPLRPPQTPAT